MHASWTGCTAGSLHVQKASWKPDNCPLPFLKPQASGSTQCRGTEEHHKLSVLLKVTCRWQAGVGRDFVLWGRSQFSLSKGFGGAVPFKGLGMLLGTCEVDHYQGRSACLLAILFLLCGLVISVLTNCSWIVLVDFELLINSAGDLLNIDKSAMGFL